MDCPNARCACWAAQIHYLVENYRSTRYIIETANDLIASNVDRMKTNRPIRIDRHRQMLPAGGEFGYRDTLSQGKVQVIQVADGASQAHAVVAELQRLRQLGVMDWSNIAVLSREHSDLAQVRTLAERESIPVRWVAGRSAMPALYQIREIHRFLTELGKDRASFKRATDLSNMAEEMFKQGPGNTWTQFLQRLLEAWKTESGNAELPVQDALESLYESCSESRREFTYGEGVTLCTVHSAKGTEFDHVLVIGPWKLAPHRDAQEEERRTFYVGITRARKTLAVFDRSDIRPSLPDSLTDRGVIRRQFTLSGGSQKEIALNYKILSLEDVYLGYAARFRENHPIHAALSAMNAGDKLTMQTLSGAQVGLFDSSGCCVARLSHKAEKEWSGQLSAVREIRVLAMVHRSADQDADEKRREQCIAQEWEFPVVEIVFEVSPLRS